MKLSLSIILGLLLALALVTGASADIELTYVSSTILETPEGTFEQSLIDEFNALDNGITVTPIGVASNDLTTKLMALAAANDLPDFYMGNELTFQAAVDMEICADISMLCDEEYLAGFNENNLSPYTVDGVVLGIPMYGGAQGVLYRKDIFDEKGLSIPTTWDAFVETAQALTVDGNYGITLVGTKDSSGNGRFQPILRNFGCDEFYQDADGLWQTDIGSEKYIEALRAFTDLDVVYGVVPPGVVETGYATAVTLFSSGKAAMLITGSNAVGAIIAQVPELKGKLGSFPNIKVERSVSTAAGFGFFITTDDVERQQASMEFMKYFVDLENSLAFAELTGRLPVRTEALEDPRIAAIPELAGFVEALDNVYRSPTIPDRKSVV